MDPKDPLGPPELPKAAQAVQEAAQPVEPMQPEAVPSSKFTPLTTVQPHRQSAEDELGDEPDTLNEHVQIPGDPDGLVAAEERRQWQAEHPAPVPMPLAKTRRKRHWPAVLITMVLIAAAAYGAYWYGSKQADKNHPQAQTQQSHTTQKTQATKQPTNVPTKHYDSTTYTLGFDYPQTWTVADTTAKLTVASPTMPLSSVDGSTVNGHVVVTIQNQQTAIAGYPAGGAIEVIESKKLTYKQPTPVQRAQTYLSYLRYTKATGLDALYITGDNGYQQGQQVPLSDVVQGNPLISVTFESCTSGDCSTGTPTMLTLLASKWDSSTVSQQIIDLLQSITLD